jgi:hypothetical protein
MWKDCCIDPKGLGAPFTFCSILHLPVRIYKTRASSCETTCNIMLAAVGGKKDSDLVVAGDGLQGFRLSWPPSNLGDTWKVFIYRRERNEFSLAPVPNSVLATYQRTMPLTCAIADVLSTPGPLIQER